MYQVPGIMNRRDLTPQIHEQIPTEPAIIRRHATMQPTPIRERELKATPRAITIREQVHREIRALQLKLRSQTTPHHAVIHLRHPIPEITIQVPIAHQVQAAEDHPVEADVNNF